MNKQTGKGFSGLRWIPMLALAVCGVMPCMSIQAEEVTRLSETSLKAPSAEYVIKGQVVDENGEPLMGVTVAIADTKIVAITDLDGNYTINATEENPLVRFSYLGYKTKEVRAKGQVLNVALEPEDNALDEVVVTALGVTKEAKSLSYNVQQINASDMNKVQQTNFVNQLNGRVAGVQINGNASGLGGSSRVVMRGAKSIDGNNNVLYVIDGIPMVNTQTSLDENALAYSGSGQTGDATAMLNQDDIESISALTGPSAAALYGADAANGVILITTKKGATGKTNISYNSSFQFSRPLMLPKFQHTYGQSEAGSYYSWGDKLITPSSYDPADFFRTGADYTNTRYGAQPDLRLSRSHQCRRHHPQQRLRPLQPLRP